MIFFHAADIHFGCQPDRNMPWSRERSFDILAAFRTLITACKREKPDLLLISGDIFHHQPSGTELKEVDALFATIPDIPVVMIAGEHDCVRVGSAFSEYKWNPNVYFLSGDRRKTVSFPKLGVTVTGFSYHQREILEPVCDHMVAPAAEGLHILLAHGGDSTHIPMDKSLCAASGFSYTALGHMHKAELNGAMRYAYPGSLSPIDMSEVGDHGYIRGELEESVTDPLGTLKLEFVPIETRSYIYCRVKVTEKTTNQSLFGTIRRFVQQYGASNIYRLTLSGVRDPGVAFDESYLRTAGRIITFSDETVPGYDISRLYHEHNRDMIGNYIDAFQDLDMEHDPINRKAFQFGLEALLSNFNSGEGGNK